jgi:hypothetical protein
MLGPSVPFDLVPLVGGSSLGDIVSGFAGLAFPQRIRPTGGARGD